MTNEFYIMSRKYFPFDRDIEVDFSLIAAVGGSAVIVKINPNNVAKIDNIPITGDEDKALKIAIKMDFINSKRVVELMEYWKKDTSMILKPEKVFVQKFHGKWYLITGKCIYYLN